MWKRKDLLRPGSRCAIPDAAGYRAKFGVIVPSTNTVVEHDFNMVAPAGITFHTGRMYLEHASLDSDESFVQVLEQIRQSMDIAIRDVLTCEPDYLVMGMSAEAFWGGVAGSTRFEERVREQARLDVSTGATSMRAALDAIGARTIAILTPYQPVADEQVKRFFEEAGFAVPRLKGLRCSSATAIAETSHETLIPALRELDGSDIDAIAQVGTNLSMLRLADESERWLGKPVVAVNAATIWHALRANGFQDTFSHFGTLLRDH
jgi:maleate isomerase